MDHINRIGETLDEYKEMIEVFKDTDFVLAQDRLNRILRILTIISAVALPFLVISGVYGMNIHLPGGLTGGGYQTATLVVLTMFLISGGMLYYFRKRHWF
jgi:magnesium transporter